MNIDDVGFISLLLKKRFMKTYNIDPNRIFATGISNGGFFSQRIACEIFDQVAAIVTVACSGSIKLFSSCKPTKPISVLIISGTKDPLVLWEGSEVGFSMMSRGKVLSVPDTARYWATKNNCLPKFETVSEID